MSWDLYVADIPHSCRVLSDLPDGWRPPVLGTANELIGRIYKAFPDADFSSSELGEINGEGFAIDVALTPSEEPVEGFMLFVRGGESAPYAVADLLHAVGCRAVDTGADDGAIFPGPDIAARWRAWRETLNRALSAGNHRETTNVPPSSLPVPQQSREQEREYQEVLSEIRCKEKSRGGWGGRLAIVVISLLAFFQLGVMQWGLEAVAVILVVLGIHELGHYAGMKVFGYRNIQLFFIPLAGAAVAGTGRNVAAWKKALVTLLGPLPGIGVGTAMAFLALLGVWDGSLHLAMMFLLLNVLNLLPVPPLDGGRFLHEVLFSRSRFLELTTNVLAAAALLSAGYFAGAWILGILGLLKLLSLAHRFKLTTTASQMRAELMRIDPGLLDHRDDGEIPEGVLKWMILRVPRSIPAATAPRMIASIAVDLWDRIRIMPPGIGATVGLLLLYVSGYLTAFVGVVAVTVACNTRNQFETKIEPVINANGAIVFVERVYLDGNPDSETELTQDRRYYHGAHRQYEGNEAYEVGRWENGWRIGTWTYRASNGEACHEIRFEAGRPVSCRTLVDGVWTEDEWGPWPLESVERAGPGARESIMPM